MRSQWGVPLTPPRPARHDGNCTIPGKIFIFFSPDRQEEKKTPPGQRRRSPATLEDVARMKGTPATDPQKHGGSTLPGPSIKKKKEKILLSVGNPIRPSASFLSATWDGAPLVANNNSFFVFFCIVAFHCGPTAEKTSRTCVVVLQQRFCSSTETARSKTTK